jgi:hypothetical protein
MGMPKINEIFNILFNIRHNYKENFVEILGLWSVRIYLFAILCANILNWLIAGFINSRLKGALIALHYNVDFGINLLGDVRQIYILPVLGLAIFLINISILLNISSGRERDFLSHALLLAALLANLTLLIAAGTIYLINFR